MVHLSQPKQAAADVWDWTTQAVIDAWNWTTKAVTDALDWTVQAAIDTWNAIKHTASFVYDWGKESLKAYALGINRLMHNIVTTSKTKGVRIVKDISMFGWNVYQMGHCAFVCFTINAVPIPAISQTVALGFAAKTGYHYSNAQKNLTDIINILFFE